MDDFLFVCMILGIVVGLPWLLLHYVTKWKQSPKITVEDEQLLDDMFLLARRLEERVQTVERIAAADHPDFKPRLTAPVSEFKSAMTGEDPAPYRLDRRN